MLTYSGLLERDTETSVYKDPLSMELVDMIRTILKQSRYRPGVAQRVLEVKVPRFNENGTGWW